MRNMYLVLMVLLSINLSFGQLTKKQEIAWEKYNATKFTTPEKFLKDAEQAFKGGLIDITEDEAECVGYFIAKALKDKYDLTKRTYGEIWDASETFCREYYKKE
ncbi:hypothetical protein PG630_10595 [Riemerella anatipestifer]|nr:hypothetical protein [Riemerella anatipestifer]